MEKGTEPFAPYYRPLKIETYLKIAEQLAEQSTCVRRKVGCVLLDSGFKVLATGYNGVAPGATHCIERPCEGANYPSGEGLDKCEAVHAEQNALLQCPDTSRIHYCIVTSSPCAHCFKLLLNTGCKIVVFGEEYVSEEVEILLKKNRHITMVKKRDHGSYFPRHFRPGAVPGD